MKRWNRRYEWMELAECAADPLHTMDNPSDDDLEQAEFVCNHCKVRPECIEWALVERACAVMVAGYYIPDPEDRKGLKLAYNYLQSQLPAERALRGEDV